MKTLKVLAILSAMFFIPAIASAVGFGHPDGSNIHIAVGDKAPLTRADLAKAHSSGMPIVIMFGSPDNTADSERTWDNLRALTAKYQNKFVEIVDDYRGKDFGRGTNDDMALAAEFGVKGEPWVVLIDKNGIVQGVFSGLAGYSMLDDEVNRLISN